MFIIKSHKGYWCNGLGWIEEKQYATKLVKKDKNLEKKLKSFFPTCKIKYINLDKERMSTNGSK